jgi:hypothetical protein
MLSTVLNTKEYESDKVQSSLQSIEEIEKQICNII